MRNIHFITAGAGSGKTYKLTNTLVDMIKNEGVRPDEVILTTFTKAAASEFKQKAMADLIKAGMETEAFQMAGAKIGTIDSVCQSFVEKYWYLLKSSPKLNVIADTEIAIFENESLDGVVSSENLIEFNQILNEFKISAQVNGITADDTDFWRKHLKKVIELSRSYGIKDYEESRRKTEEFIDSIFCEDNVDWDYVNDFMENDAKMAFKKDKGEKKPVDMTAVAAMNEAYSYGFLKNKYCFLVKTSNALKKYIDNKGSGRPIDGMCDFSAIKGGTYIIPSSWIKYIDYCDKAIRSKEFGKKIKGYAGVIFSIAQSWASQYAEYKKEHHLIDYNDMECQFLELLKEYSQVTEEIRSDYRIIMVDEYQDCNPLQVEIFNRLSDIIASREDGKGRTIFVGDRKQSIYGFRGCDMELIDTVIRQFPNPESNLTIGVLPDSYRSRKKLVDSASEIFKGIFSDKGLTAKRVVRGEDDMPDVPALCDWNFIAGNKDGYFKSLAERIGQLINGQDPEIKNVVEYEHTPGGYKQLEIRPVQVGDIAVLVRSNNDVTSLTEALNAIGISVNVVEKNLKEFVEIQLMLAILGYCLQPSAYAKAQILYLLEGKTVENIIEEQISGELKDLNAIIDRIDKIIGSNKGQSLTQIVETLIIELDIWNVVAKWGDLARRHSHISTFQQTVQGYEEHTRLLGLAPSIMGFLNYFNNSDVVPDMPFIKDDSAVSILTYHKSKGLEWPIVIMSSLESDSLSEGSLVAKELFGVHHAPANKNEINVNDRGEYITLMVDVTAGGKMPDSILNAMKPMIAPGSDRYISTAGEAARLLYVGFTRAKDYLITTSFEGKTGSYKWLKDVGCYSDDNIWKTSMPVSKTTGIPLPSTADEKASSYSKIVYSMPEASEEPLERYITPSTLGMKTLEAKVSVSEPIHISGAIDFGSQLDDESMSLVGTCIHNIYASFDSNASKDESIRRAEGILVSNGFSQLADKSSGIIDAISALYGFLRKEYGEGISVYHELPMLMQNEKNQILTGEIDLVWQTSEGCVIIDFKNKKDMDTATDSARHYAPQLNAYREALQKSGEIVLATLLFYPIQGTMVSIDIQREM